MTYTWYYIFNSDDFEALGLVSKTYTLNLDGIGLKDIVVTKGNFLGLTYEDVFLPINLNDKNPFEFEDFAVYIDDEAQVWLGILIEEEE